MDTHFKHIALIVAGGRGSRMQSATPKTYLPLAGKPVLRHTVQAFLQHPKVDAVQIVIHADDADLYASAIEGLDVLPPILGGATRQASVANGLAAIAKHRPNKVLIHDAARPNVSADVIDAVLEGLQTHHAVIPAVAVADTIKRASKLGEVLETIDRSQLRAAQTPQGFHFGVIHDLHQRASGMEFTDDAAICEDFGVPTWLVEGSELNRKITTQHDLKWMEKIMQEPQVRVGQGYDVHAFEAGDHVMLCGVKAPHSHGLKGHSDADVGLHALTDAILGALGKGDIGEFFPPSDPQWKGADSSIFIEKCVELCRQMNATISNVDITLICEAPKIGPHKTAMKARVAALLQLDESQVNIKATTTEGLGFTGRKEGIAAQAIATIVL